VCAALLALVVEADLRALRERAPRSPALRRYADAARPLTGRNDATADDAAWLPETVAALGVPSLDLRRPLHTEIAQKAARSSSMRGNSVFFGPEKLVAVLRAAQ
jgi:hypothetical protein